MGQLENYSSSYIITAGSTPGFQLKGKSRVVIFHLLCLKTPKGPINMYAPNTEYVLYVLPNSSLFTHHPALNHRHFGVKLMISSVLWCSEPISEWPRKGDFF